MLCRYVHNIVYTADFIFNWGNNNHACVGVYGAGGGRGGEAEGRVRVVATRS